jgi:hypothetical protein
MYQLQLKERIAGYSLKSAKKDELVNIQCLGATSIEDGDLHLKYLEGFPQKILSMLPVNIFPSEIKTMVVLISHDLKANIYINEAELIAEGIVKAKEVKKGQEVTKDDLLAFTRVKIGNINFPEDHAYFCILPIGWDQLYVFDFSPLNDRDFKITYDIEKLIGEYFTYLSFKSIHKIDNSVWLKILSQNWFLFSALKFSTIESIINYAKSDWDIDELIEKINRDIIDHLQEWIPIWIKNIELKPFIEFLEIALDRHNNEDYISSSSIIYPKIEGLMRYDFIKDNPEKEGRRQNPLVNHVTEKTFKKYSSLTSFLPERFKEYLSNCYFRDFLPSRYDNLLSRHSVAHGASSKEQYRQKDSLVGLLVFAQIVKYLQFSNG